MSSAKKGSDDDLVYWANEFAFTFPDWGEREHRDPPDMLKCDHCGGFEFNVGVGDDSWSVRCIQCMIEVCIDDGAHGAHLP